MVLRASGSGLRCSCCAACPILRVAVAGSSARGGGRTRMALRPRDFKSLAYTSFATRARGVACLTAARLQADAKKPAKRPVSGQPAHVRARNREGWRPGSELNRRTRLCRPLHDHSATRPVTHWIRYERYPDCGWNAQARAGRKNKTPGWPGFHCIWSGKRDSNSRPQPWQGCALPTELFPRGRRNFTVRGGSVNRNSFAGTQNRPRGAQISEPRPQREQRGNRQQPVADVEDRLAQE